MTNQDLAGSKLAAGWTLPPEQLSYNGNERRVGIEIEFAGIDGFMAADTVCNTFGGRIDQTDSYRWKISETELGDFEVELDVTYAHKQDGGKASKLPEWFRELVGIIGQEVAPFEIVSPPIPLSSLPVIDRLVSNLRDAGAEGTYDQPWHAFGLQLNPEVAALDADYIWRHLQAFILLEDWLREDIKLDSLRQILPFADPFPQDYVRYLVEQEKAPPLERLVDDYIGYNPTRNRGLDMMPLFAFLDERKILERLKDPRIKPRPTFHYRLPNSLVSDRGWMIADDWNRWVEVERLASNTGAREQLRGYWLTNQDRLIPKDWNGILRAWRKGSGKNR